MFLRTTPVQIVDIVHPDQGTVSKANVKDLLAAKFKVADNKTIIVFGFKPVFGGGKTTGFACIYDTLEDALDTEPAYRLRRDKHLPVRTGSRKQRREAKNKRLKVSPFSQSVFFCACAAVSMV